MSCECSGQWHGGVYGVHLFSFTEMNWKTVVNDTQYLAWIASWRDIAGADARFPGYMEGFLQHLLVMPSFPVLFLHDRNRINAPLFVVAHSNGVRSAHCRCFQFGCRYCKCQTQFLYPAADPVHQRLALETLMTFFEPLFHQFLRCRGVPLPTAPPTSPLPPPPPTNHAADVTTNHTKGSWKRSCDEDGNIWLWNGALKVWNGALCCNHPKGSWKRYRDNEGRIWYWNDAADDFFYHDTGTKENPLPGLTGLPTPPLGGSLCTHRAYANGLYSNR